MRLIDADELKKAITEATYNFEQIPIRVNEVMQIIDNAPTERPSLNVKDLTEEDIKNFAVIYQRATSKGLILEPERPQGKWIFKHNSSDIWCSVCDENFDEIPQKFNYCPNCGADMRGEDHD